jgi:hypothetical protein
MAKIRGCIGKRRSFLYIAKGAYLFSSTECPEILSSLRHSLSEETHHDSATLGSFDIYIEEYL